jgi:aspartate/methionine/tyrosine aminotransferase
MLGVFKRARRLEDVVGFGIDRVAAAADRAARANPAWPVLRMENLDTDLPLPPEAIPVTVESLATPPANSWLPFTGDHALREAISDFLAERTRHRYDPEREIVITSGGMEALLDVLLATIDPGDEVVLTDPTYAGLVNRVRLAGASPRFAPFRGEGGEWMLDLDGLHAAVGPKTTALVLMSPSMPSGGTFTADDWSAICDLCRDRDLPLLYDSAMERLLFDGRPLVHPLHHDGTAERTVVVGSLSKEHRMIGWRVGWAAGPADVIESVGWVHVYNTTTPTGIARAAAAAVLRGDQGHVAECVQELESRRDTILEVLPGWPFVSPGGGWSMLVDVRSRGVEPAEASRLLLEEMSVAATPMTGWGRDVAAGHVRLVFSAEPIERLRTLGERAANTRLAAALSG